MRMKEYQRTKSTIIIMQKKSGRSQKPCLGAKKAYMWSVVTSSLIHSFMACFAFSTTLNVCLTTNIIIIFEILEKKGKLMDSADQKW